MSDDRERCQYSDCDELAVARWHDGMWGGGFRCFEHTADSLNSRDRLESYRDEITTEANLTTIGSGRNESRIVPAGAKPIAGPWACIRTVECLRHWIKQHDTEVDL